MVPENANPRFKLWIQNTLHLLTEKRREKKEKTTITKNQIRLS